MATVRFYRGHWVADYYDANKRRRIERPKGKLPRPFNCLDLETGRLNMTRERRGFESTNHGAPIRSSRLSGCCSLTAPQAQKKSQKSLLPAQPRRSRHGYLPSRSFAHLAISPPKVCGSKGLTMWRSKPAACDRRRSSGCP